MNIFGNTAFVGNTAFIDNPPAQIYNVPESHKTIKFRLINKMLKPGFKDSGLCQNIPSNPHMTLKGKMRSLKKCYRNVSTLYFHRMELINHLVGHYSHRTEDLLAMFRSDYLQDITTLEIRYYEVILNETSPIDSPRRISITEIDRIAIEHAQAEDRVRVNASNPTNTAVRLRRGSISRQQPSGQPTRISNLSETD